MPDYDYIFANQADTYEAFVSKEDYQNNLLSTIGGICPLSKTLQVADLGTGTGRVAFLLAPFVDHVAGIEPVKGMRKQALLKKKKLGIHNVNIREGNHENVPLPDRSVDLVIEGWALLVVFSRTFPDWRPGLDRALAEMDRIAKPRGHIVLIETNGTVTPWDSVPDQVQIFHDYLEKEKGFNKKIIRTDYKFETVDQATDMIGFFFGEEMGQQVRRMNSPIVPEATAVWWRSQT